MPLRPFLSYALYSFQGTLTIQELRTPKSDHDAIALGLNALGWVLADEKRAERLLSLTGLTPDRLREGLDDPAVVGAVLEFLVNHEPDLVQAAEALDVAPETLVAAARELAR